jgi:eukaryotic-like serine/threonine-protein kinase
VNEPKPLRSGEHVAPGYRVFGLLRRGEDVDVYDVWSEERDCRCVVKALRPDRMTSRSARRRLLTEGRLLQSLAHPHLVRAYDVQERPTPLVVLETLTGDTLGYLIDDDGPRLPLFELGVLGVQLCSALTYLHRNGVLHLDLKPSNVICQGEQAKLIDLGIAAPPGRGRRGVGTPAYMAPEQIRGGTLSDATDVWALGVLLYEAATRVQPFGDDGWTNDAAVPTPIRRLRRLPPRIGETIDACLSPQPAGRPTIAVVAKRLRSVAV